MNNDIFVELVKRMEEKKKEQKKKNRSVVQCKKCGGWLQREVKEYGRVKTYRVYCPVCKIKTTEWDKIEWAEADATRGKFEVDNTMRG